MTKWNDHPILSQVVNPCPILPYLSISYPIWHLTYGPGMWCLVTHDSPLGSGSCQSSRSLGRNFWMPSAGRKLWVIYPQKILSLFMICYASLSLSLPLCASALAVTCSHLQSLAVHLHPASLCVCQNMLEWLQTSLQTLPDFTLASPASGVLHCKSSLLAAWQHVVSLHCITQTIRRQNITK